MCVLLTFLWFCTLLLASSAWFHRYCFGNCVQGFEVIVSDFEAADATASGPCLPFKDPSKLACGMLSIEHGCVYTDPASLDNLDSIHPDIRLHAVGHVEKGTKLMLH